MLALGLTVALFAFFGLVGYATLRAVGTRFDPVQEMLLAPVVGVVVLTIGVFLISRVGVPVVKFAYPLTIGLVVAAITPMLIKRPRLLWRDWRAFGGILLLALVASGWPMVEFNFDWLSLCNDDMANYCLGAERFYDYGYFHPPTVQQLVEAKDYTLFYWYLHVASAVRPGIELLIAWGMAVSRLSAEQVFMPLNLAFHLCQVSALGALMHPSPATRRPALAGCALLAVSALATFGVIYQLIAQVLGMALVAGTAAILLRSYAGEARGALVRRGIAAGVMGVGLFLNYPEVIPIVGAAWMLYLLGEALARRVPPKAVAAFLLPSLAVVLLVVGRQVIGFAFFLFGQATMGTASAELQEVFFPFYQLPSGLADFWGFFPLMYVPPEPLGSFGVAAGALLLLLAVGAAAWRSKRGEPVAFVCAVMFGLATFLVLKRAHFGVYKIAMFLQPFVLGTVALAAYAIFKRPRAAAVALLVLALPGVYTQLVYVLDSRGTGTAGGFPEIADPSRSKINDQFVAQLAAHEAAAKQGGLVLDTSNVVLAKFQAQFTRGISTVFTGTGAGTSMANFDRRRSMAPKATLDLADEIQGGVKQKIQWYEFDLKDPADPALRSKFMYRHVGPFAEPRSAGEPPPLMVVEGPKQSLLNRWGARKRIGAEADETNFFTRPLDRLRDHLAFIDSEYGRSYYNARYDVSKYQLEPDTVFYGGETMAGVGRRMLMQVFRPSPGMRLVVEVTASLNSDNENLLPTQAAAVGTTRQAFGITGRGSARVFSPPVEPQKVGDWSFVAIDLGRDARPLLRPRKGLMRLYGQRVSLDRRLLVCYGRNVSAVSARDYAAMRPPSRLESFPKDLRNQDVEYSGFYEDGWLSDHAWCALSEPWNAAEVVVKGYVPEIRDPGFQTEATLLVNGREVKRQVLGLKEFEIRAAMPPDASASQKVPGRSRVELVFSKLQDLPDPDNRPVSCRLVSVAIEGGAAPPVAVQKFPEDYHQQPLLSPSGLYPDGWTGPQVALTLSQPPGHGHLKVSGEMPQIGDANFETTLRVKVDGQSVGEQALRVGQFDLSLPAPRGTGSAGGRRVELEFTRPQQLPGGDARTVGARLMFLGFVPYPLPPAALARFPDDLRKPLVQAEGVYDDGWAAQSATLQLAQPTGVESVRVAGMVPRIDAADFTTELVVTVDGAEVGRRTLGLDQFSLEFPVPPAASPGAVRKVALRFTATQSLPAPDARAVGARLSAVGFFDDGG